MYARRVFVIPGEPLGPHVTVYSERMTQMGVRPARKTSPGITVLGL